MYEKKWPLSNGPEGLRFKEERFYLQWMSGMINPELAYWLIKFADERMTLFGNETVVTELRSTLAEDHAYKRQHKFHRWGDAADIRSRNWELDEEKHAKKFWKQTAKSRHKRLRFAFSHRRHGTGAHFHIDIREIKQK